MRYGTKTRFISFSLMSAGIILLLVSAILYILNSTWFVSILSVSLVILFPGVIIYLVIYKQFEKLSEIANEIEKE